MYYINALKLIDLSVQNNILAEKDGGVFVYKSQGEKYPEGWFLEDKDLLAKELMKDEEGQTHLISALKEKGVEYTPAVSEDNFDITL